MPSTLQQRDQLMMHLADLLGAMSLEDQTQAMETALELAVSGKLIPEEQMSVIRTDDPLTFSLDLIGTNEQIEQLLNLYPMAFQTAMKARDPEQMLGRLALL